MKIQLDYDNNVIRLENTTNLGEFFKKIKTLLPDWKKWNLDTQTTIEWANPITIPWYPGPYYPNYPYYPQPWYDMCDGSVSINLTNQSASFTTEHVSVVSSGVYCLNIQDNG